VLYEREGAAEVPAAGPGTFVAAVPALSAHVGEIADRFFGAPSQALTVAGITGTNGKTTCAWLLAQALEHCRRRAAYMGTPLRRAAAGDPDRAHHPDAVTVHRHRAAARSVRSVCMEVSSHALDQARQRVRFNTAAFTNLTRDHPSTHGTMQAYGPPGASAAPGPPTGSSISMTRSVASSPPSPPRCR
jgi:UDP-N-acetylmuramoyl-L-alanyl-D-glutamate--2,6-diaminopimelate ligase